MFLLQAGEQYLGSLNTWPASIITYLFAETPSPPVVEELTAFYAGNDVPTTLAYILHHIHLYSFHTFYTPAFLPTKGLSSANS